MHQKPTSPASVLPVVPRHGGAVLLDGARLLAGVTLLGLIGCAWSLVALPLALILPRRGGRAVGRGFARLGFRLYLKALSAMGACKFDLSALEGLPLDPPMIIAPNHPCLLDAPMLISRLQGLGCVMKADIGDNLVFGAAARLAGYIRNDAPRSMISEAILELNAGHHLLLFPEGTRTTGGPVGPIRASVGLIAKHAGVPIQTVLIQTDSRFLGKGWPLLRIPEMPVCYRVRLGRRFAPPLDVHACVAELEVYFALQVGTHRLSEPEALD